MKKLFLIAVVAIYCQVANAQKIFRVYVDKFSGDTVIETKLETIYLKSGFSPSHKVTAAILKTKNYSYLELEITEPTSDLFMVKDGMNSSIKFTNGDIISITCPKTEIAKTYYYSSISTIDAVVYYTINNDDIDKLKNNKLSVLRITTTEGNYDYDIPDNKSEIIKKQLMLIDK